MDLVGDPSVATPHGPCRFHGGEAVQRLANTLTPFDSALGRIDEFEERNPRDPASGKTAIFWIDPV